VSRYARAVVTLRLSQDHEADELLSQDSFALLIGMVLDQQVPLEWAFAAPAELLRRLGRPLEPSRLAAMDPDELSAAFTAKPALHRYPGSMATRVHELSRLITDRYGGRVENIWTGVDTAAELLRRVKELPGFGDQKARIFVALLGKQFGVRPDGWQAASAPYGEPGSFRSVADITGPDSLTKVRAFKAELKAAHKSATATARRAPKATTTKATAATRTVATPAPPTGAAVTERAAKTTTKGSRAKGAPRAGASRR